MDNRKRTEYAGQERRHYIRMDSVFPVEFRLVSADQEQFLSDWLQGFTNDVSKGGICLAVNHLGSEPAGLLQARQVRIILRIEMPLSGTLVPACARVAWVKTDPALPSRYLIGLSYEEIEPVGNERIMRYARAKRVFVPALLGVIGILLSAFAAGSYLNFKLIKGNKALVEQLVNIVQESSVAKQEIKKIYREKEGLNLKIEALGQRIRTTEEEKAAAAEEAKRVVELNASIAKLNREKEELQERLIALQHQENTVSEDLLRLDKIKATLEKANVDKMYRWLKIHQNPRTGLVISFEGDSNLTNWAFLYDQSLALQAYAYFADYERARKLLDFFQRRAARKDGRFYNAYYASDGSPAESVVHSGPNIWLGLAALQYTKRSNDRTYLALAEEIASAIISLQKEDPDGGIRGGPDVTWFATEHNLDAYAFFDMLYTVTGKSAYAQARDKVLQWLLQHTYDKGEVPIKRGKGDSTIATDTYAWSVAAIGPGKLEELGMNPDRVMEFAEEHCSVQVSYQRPEGGAVTVRGFDFAPERHVGRGGVVSAEWTAQMVMSFKIMADYYYKKEMTAKARSYTLKAEEYLAQLGNMVISSPSPSGQGESCLPYATLDYVDTGHGWMTPKGKSTGSVAGTAYTLFAYYSYNPLRFEQ